MMMVILSFLLKMKVMTKNIVMMMIWKWHWWQTCMQGLTQGKYRPVYRWNKNCFSHATLCGISCQQFCVDNLRICTVRCRRRATMCIDVSRVICSIAIILLILFCFLSHLMKLKTQTTGILKTRVLKKCYELLWLRDTDCSDTRHMEPDIKLLYSVDHNFKAIILYALALDKPTTFLQNKTATPSGSHNGRDIIHMIW